MLFRQRSEQSSKVRDVHIVHRLHRIVEYKPGKLRRYCQMQRYKQCQCSGVQVAGAQHRARGTASIAALEVFRDELWLQPLRVRLRNPKRRHKRLAGSQAHKKVSPEPVQAVVELASNDFRSDLIYNRSYHLALFAKNLTSGEGFFSLPQCGFLDTYRFIDSVAASG